MQPLWKAAGFKGGHTPRHLTVQPSNHFSKENFTQHKVLRLGVCNTFLIKCLNLEMAKVFSVAWIKESTVCLDIAPLQNTKRKLSDGEGEDGKCVGK